MPTRSNWQICNNLRNSYNFKTMQFSTLNKANITQFKSYCLKMPFNYNYLKEVLNQTLDRNIYIRTFNFDGSFRKNQLHANITLQLYINCYQNVGLLRRNKISILQKYPRTTSQVINYLRLMMHLSDNIFRKHSFNSKEIWHNLHCYVM